MNNIDQKRKTVGVPLAAAEKVQETFTIFNRCWQLFRNFYLIEEQNDQEWEVVVQEVMEIGQMGESKTEQEIAVQMGITVCRCLEILSKHNGQQPLQKEPA